MKDEHDLEQYSRQLILNEIGPKGQKKINNSSVIIIGLGGLGSSVLQYLSAAGVGKIGLADYDKVEISNLNRQVIYSREDIKKNKVEVAREFSIRLNPSLKLKTYNEKIEEKNIREIIKDYDYIADCSDNYETRLVINDACFYLEKTWVMCSVGSFFGQISTFQSHLKDKNKTPNPSYRCLTNDKILNEDDCNNIGVLGSVAGTMGALQATEILKIIINNKNNLINKVLIFDLLTLQNKILKLKWDPNNILNGKKSKKNEYN